MIKKNTTLLKCAKPVLIRETVGIANKKKTLIKLQMLMSEMLTLIFVGK